MRPMTNLCLLLVVTVLLSSAADALQATNNEATTTCRRYKHLIVLVHGYLGSDKEQSYLGQTLTEKAQSLLISDSSPSCPQHKFLVVSSKANVHDTTDGVAKGGERLAKEVQEWIQEHSSSEKEETLTLSFIGNSLGGLFSRYAIGELHLETDLRVLPLVFATTSTPHLGVTNETFIPLPRWAEELVGNLLAQSGKDMFWLDGHGVMADMCSYHSRFLQGLEQFQKRIAVANAYNTDFLVSVSSGAFLSQHSESVHYTLSDHNSTTAIRLMENEHVILQVQTTPESVADNNSQRCTDNLDRLGWHKIFLDTRSALPDFLSLEHDPVPQQSTYTSRELQDLLAKYGTILPVAHPLNMANSKTEWYSLLTAEGRPIMDALADMLIQDMIRLSEQPSVLTQEKGSSQPTQEEL